MANIKSDLQTKQDAARTSPSSGIRHGDDLAGILCIATAKITIPATVAANDTIEFIPPLPQGAVPIPQLSSLTLSGDPTDGTLRINIGDALDADRYAAALNVDAGGSVILATSIPDGAINPYRFPEPMAIIGTVTASTGTKTERTAVLIFAYRMKG